MHRHDLLQAIAPVRRRSQPEQMPGASLPHTTLERERRQVVAFVDHDQAVTAEEPVEILDRFQALDHRQIDEARPLAAATAELADLLPGQTEELSELDSLLLEQRLPVREHERRHGAVGDHGAPHHRLAASRRSHEYAFVVGEHLGHGGRLLRGQDALELEVCAGVCRSPVVGNQPAARVPDGRLDLFEQPAGKVQVGQVFLVAADQARRSVGGEPQPLPLVEHRVVERGQMP